MGNKNGSNFTLLFDGCNITNVTEISIFGVIHNELIFMNDMAGLKYSN